MGEFLDNAVLAFGSRTAVVSVLQNHRFSYNELHSQVIKASKALVSKGIKSGDRVGVWSTNRSEWIILQFAVSRIGAILVHINPAYKEN